MNYDEKLVLKKLNYIITKNNLDPSDIDIEIDYPAGAVEKWLSGEKNSELTNTLGNYLENIHNIKFKENKLPKIFIIFSIIITVLLTLMICSIILISYIFFQRQKNNLINNKDKTHIDKKEDNLKSETIEKNQSSAKKDENIIKPEEKIELEIIDPKNGESIGIDRIQILSDDQISIHIKISCKNEDLIPEGTYLSCIASVLSGEEVYVTGKSTGIISDQMMMDYITLGSLDDENKYYELFVILGNERLKSGTTFSVIPDHIIRSKKITVEINKKEIKKNLNSQ